MASNVNFCVNCFCDNVSGRCPVCGYDNNAHITVPHHLKPGTILNGKYILGRMIGEGGFGITYAAKDAESNTKVAIKEYFPNGFATRNTASQNSVTVFSGVDSDEFASGRAKFLREAKALAKFNSMPGIVSVRAFFEANDTAYIVMEYIDGETLGHYLDKNGGRLPAGQVFNMMKPVMRSLAVVHKAGIIHRDISPDNIMVGRDLSLKLIDFGAAREMSANGSKSLSIQLKPGFAPEEQYRTHGEQGAWTDVYALCATMYRAITGHKPPESLDRLKQDNIVKPSMYGITIDASCEAALMLGLAVRRENRMQSVEALYNAIYNPGNRYGGDQYNAPPQYDGRYNNYAPVSQSKGKSKLLIVIVIISALILAGIAGFVTYRMFMSDDEPSGKNTPATETVTDAPPPEFTSYSASSTRGADHDAQGTFYYYESYAVDGDMNTAWSSNRHIELTPTFTFTAATPQRVHGVMMTNGYCKSQQTYTRNRRITQVTIEYEGGSKTQRLEPNAYRVMQDIAFDEPVDTTYIKVHIDDSIYGDWLDIAVSEIEVY